jgi:hypothetical protein
MKRKSPQIKIYLNLWKDTGQRHDHDRFVNDRRKSLLKKTIDNICMNADLTMNVQDYTSEVVDGIIYLYSIGFKPSEIMSHNLLLQKLLSLGRDILEKTHQGDDMFYLGAFLDLKMTSKWKDINFFKFLKNALNKIHMGIALFSEKLKNKILEEYKLYFPKDFDLFFTIPLKSTA